MIFGSSPRARGTLTGPQDSANQRRFIPACAGNAYRPSRQRQSASVHPRVRGERGPLPVRHCLADGSSPRARGTPSPASHAARGRRFIPACAGNALHLHAVGWDRPVHPRVRGERVSGGTITSVTVGSSPRARGTQVSGPLGSIRIRFIPACGGNARAAARPRGRGSVHPRVRGERTAATVGYRPAVGSSPRARGTPPQAPRAARAFRFIPACAGNAVKVGSSGSAWTVHPRVRGERDWRIELWRKPLGSSPRARGTRGPLRS